MNEHAFLGRRSDRIQFLREESSNYSECRGRLERRSVDLTEEKHIHDITRGKKDSSVLIEEGTT